MPTHRAISINLDRIHDIALRGVRRTYVFLGFGLNAANNPDFNQFHLNARYTIRLMPEKVSDENIAEFKRSFGIWIISNGLRELTESSSVFLSEIYQACLIVEVAQGKFASGKMPVRRRRFDNKNITEQLTSLSDDYGIQCNFLDHIDSLRHVRNCLTHRRGIVGPRDYNRGEKLILKWRGMEFVILEDGKQEIVIPLHFDKEIHVEAGGRVGMRMVNKTKEFSKGSLISISETELLEICLTMQLAAGEIRDSAVQFFRQRNVPINTGAKSN